VRVREARQEQNGDQTFANYDQQKSAKTGKLKVLKRGRFAAARANGMFGKDLQAAVFAIHQDAPGTLTRALACLLARFRESNKL